MLSPSLPRCGSVCSLSKPAPPELDLPSVPPMPDVWAHHWKSARWGRIVEVSDCGNWYLLYFPDLKERAWRRASAFVIDEGAAARPIRASGRETGPSRCLRTLLPSAPQIRWPRSRSTLPESRQDKWASQGDMRRGVRRNTSNGDINSNSNNTS